MLLHISGKPTNQELARRNSPQRDFWPARDFNLPRGAFIWPQSVVLRFAESRGFGPIPWIGFCRAIYPQWFFATLASCSARRKASKSAQMRWTLFSSSVLITGSSLFEE